MNHKSKIHGNHGRPIKNKCQIIFYDIYSSKFCLFRSLFVVLDVEFKSTSAKSYLQQPNLNKKQGLQQNTKEKKKKEKT